jgi:hypothetical protein
MPLDVFGVADWLEEHFDKEAKPDGTVILTARPRPTGGQKMGGEE